MGLAVLAIALFAAFGVNRQPQAQFFTAPVERGTIRAQVEATGTIKRSDFGVTTYLPAVGDEVQLSIAGAFEQQV